MAQPYFEAAAAVVIATSVVNLRTVDSNLYKDAQLGNVQAVDTFEWNAASAAVDDGVNIVIPDDITHPAPGRWLVIPNVHGPTTVVTDKGVPSWDGTGRLLQDNPNVRITAGGALELGATVATAGDVRLPDTGSIQAWGTGPVNVPMLAKTAADNLSIGLGSAAGANPPQLDYGCNSTHVWYANGTWILSAHATALNINVSTAGFAAAAVAPTFKQANDATVGVAADALGFIAQSATGGGASMGGTAYVQGGTGATPGAAEFRDSAGVADVRSNTLGTHVLRGITLSDVSITVADTPYTIPQGVVVIGIDSTGGAIAMMLPSASDNPGQYFCVKDEANGCTATPCTVQPGAGETIDLIGPAAPFNINADGQCQWFHSDGGTNWRLV